MDIYRNLVRPLLFSGLALDPEWMHQQALQSIHWLATHRTSPWGQRICDRLSQTLCQADPRLSQTHWGLTFANPLGLAAGFDKDGLGAPLWGNFGFGFAELGTVTGHGQPGNPRPRLFRLPADQAVLNRMGFNNQGAQALAQALQAQALQAQALQAQALQATVSQPELGPRQIPLGINLGKSKITPLESALEDYRASFRALQAWGDYFVINVSSPNTPGLRSLQTRQGLAPILGTIQAENQHSRPLFVKVAPDLSWEELGVILELVQDHNLAGIIATNTTIARSQLQTQRLDATGKAVTEEAGGISGAPLRDRSTEVIRFLWRHSQGQVPIIGVGGIFTATDAWEKITAGACLLQVYTGWIYEGPWMVRRIVQGLGERLTAAGMDHVSEAIGSQAVK